MLDRLESVLDRLGVDGDRVILESSTFDDRHALIDRMAGVPPYVTAVYNASEEDSRDRPLEKGARRSGRRS